jgi:oxygen-independent coproporphyrinogen-3 oxidase
MFDIRIGDEIATIDLETLMRYSRPGPRYTSYPTVPEWDDSFDGRAFDGALREAASARPESPLSLYLHLPFCRSLCLFCGCNVVVSRDSEIAVPYLDRLGREIASVADVIGARPVEQIHWGGGSPTFLAPAQIEELFGALTDRFTISDTAEVSVELDPRTTTDDQCRTFRSVGFNRVSMGVQDFDEMVQQTVRRIQSYEMVRRIFDRCRSLGFESINVDLIYGLPHQTPESFLATIDKVVELSPDRIALFSYAHVPWLKKQQGSFARHLPDTVTKFRIFLAAIERLLAAGYEYIGLDHFVRRDDELFRARQAGTLHRNFQGYTTKAGCELIGMGASSISALEDVYAQNDKSLLGYYEAIDRFDRATVRGIRLTSEDKLRRAVIGEILCNGRLLKRPIEQAYGIDFDAHFAGELAALEELRTDEMVEIDQDGITVTPLGRIFLRVVAMTFDAYLHREAEEGRRVFSNTV